MSNRTITPTDEELTNVLRGLRAEHPALGIAKLHALLLSSHESWTVSEKRTRKLLQAAGLTNTPAATANGNAVIEKGRVYPESRVMSGLDLEKWSAVAKIEVKQFGPAKGKGLVARIPLKEGDVVWKEDPWIIAPEWDIYDLQVNGSACAHCTTPFSPSSTLLVSCPGSSGSSVACPARFCNRLCLSRSAQTHPLLCPARNPASRTLVQLARRSEWMALHALAQTAARVLLAVQEGNEALEREWDVYQGLAVLGMEERAKDDWFGHNEPDREAWKRAHQLFVQALQDPSTEADKKKLARILKKPIPAHVTSALFDYDNFLRGLGRMSLNLEAHGGLYALHSHLNHSCTPNISVRHLDQRNALARITLIAKADIAPGEELVVTYVNPMLNVRARRRKLGEWGFGVCRCARCENEEKELREKGEWDKAQEEQEDDDLASELKKGFGVV